MRKLLAATLLFGLTACSSADDKKDKDKEREPKTLKVGDPAPPLKVAAWVNGEGVKSFAPGKVYVLDFWATWCGPCIMMMPHLAELGHEYKDKGLVVVAVTTADDKNPRQLVERFAKKRGPKLGFPFAVCDTDETDVAYRDASGSTSLPATFVVDKEGKIAYIGHPLFLEEVVPKVLAGTWRGKADADEVVRMMDDFEGIIKKANRGAEAGLAAIAAFEAKYPAAASRPMFQSNKLQFLLSAKKYDDAKALTEAMLPKLIEKKSAYMLSSVRAAWTDSELNPEHKYIDLAVKAADAQLAVEGDKDPMALIGAAAAYHAAGNKAKAVELAKQAIAHAEDDDQKDYFKEQLERYQK